MSTFGETLAHFKLDSAEENCVENLTPLVEDSDLRNGIVAWKSVAVRYKTSDECPYSDEARMWAWLWSVSEFDKKGFGEVAGLKSQDVNQILTRLVGLRLIYPDGTINTLARQYLQAIIMSKIGGKSGPGRPKKSK